MAVRIALACRCHGTCFLALRQCPRGPIKWGYRKEVDEVKNSRLVEELIERNNLFVSWLLSPPFGFSGAANLSGATHYLKATELWDTLPVNEVSRLISDAIQNRKPTFVGRFGSTELRAVLKVANRSERNWPERIFAMLARFESPVWSPWEYRNLRSQSGFFPISKASVDQFADLVRTDLKQLDLLGSWVPGENKLISQLQEVAVCWRESLEPFWAEEPWTNSLAEKRILVVHPFEESIRTQYQSRELLFHKAGLLPKFELKVLKSPQTIGRNQSGYETWFDALTDMKNAIESTPFDVLIAGCGAYGFHLAAHAKRIGKVGIHLGGVTQVLFGIRGRRWDSDPKFANLFNKHWVHPLKSERPPGWQRVDHGVYW